jgi:hypothetical protein
MAITVLPTPFVLRDYGSSTARGFMDLLPTRLGLLGLPYIHTYIVTIMTGVQIIAFHIDTHYNYIITIDLYFSHCNRFRKLYHMYHTCLNHAFISRGVADMKRKELSALQEDFAYQRTLLAIVAKTVAASVFSEESVD